MWKANGKTTILQLFLDSLSPKTEKLSFEEAMDLSRDRLILELEADLTINPINCLTDIVANSTRNKLTNVVEEFPFSAIMVHNRL
jgi:hypothetical protein